MPAAGHQRSLATASLRASLLAMLAPSVTQRQSPEGHHLEVRAHRQTRTSRAVADGHPVSAVHVRHFSELRCANTLLPVAAAVGMAYRVEIEAEAEAVVDAQSSAAAALGRGYFVLAK